MVDESISEKEKMDPTELRKWFIDEVLPKLVADGHFAENGETQTIEEFEFEPIEQGVSNFASFPSFAKLVLKTETGTMTREILVKFQGADPIFREKMRTVPQFKNEIAMYNQIIPGFIEFLKRCNQNPDVVRNAVPVCYFGSFDEVNPVKSIVVLEDLRKDGFKLAESMVDLDLKHCLLALERLAQFHAISFAMKFKEWKPFNELKKLFVHVWMTDEPTSREECETFRKYLAQRGINYLLEKKNSEVPENYLENLKRLLEPFFEFITGLYSPLEPMSVICHGDFNRNNLLFKYENGEVTDAKLIDFQTFIYASPCLDISFLIYMNTTQDFREKHFEELLRHYHKILTSTISRIVNEPEVKIAERIPLRAFADEFSRVAISAYVLVSFFLPVMMFPSGADFMEDLKTKTFEELAKENYVLGGEVASRRIADVIVDFYKRKFYM